MGQYSFFENYIKLHGSGHKILYTRSNNKLKNLFNYYFRRFGTLNVIHKDDLCVFTINERNIVKISACFSNNFQDFSVAYRGLRFVGNTVVETELNRGSDYKIARGQKKTILSNYLKRKIFGEFYE